MRLLIVSTWLPYPPDNGSRVRAYQLLRHLSRRHAITLLTFSSLGSEVDRGRLSALCERVEVVPRVRPSDDRLALRGLVSRVPRYFVQTNNFRMQALIEEHLDRHDAAVALQVDAAFYLAGRAQIPRVFEEAEVSLYRDRYLGEKYLPRRFRYLLTWWKFAGFVRGLTADFDSTTVVSHQERKLLGEIGCDLRRVSVVPNGTDIPDVRNPPGRFERLVYAGSVTYHANRDAVEYFVRDIFPRIRQSRPGMEFWVSGSTEGIDLADMAQTGGVRFTGRLPEVDSLVAGSSVCVVPLRVGGGTRLKVLQAMALGTPVVATPKGVEGLEVESGRHLLVADSPATFAAAVLRLLDDEPLRRRVTRDARQLVAERYAWGPIAEGLEGVLTKAVSDHRCRV